MRSSNTKRTHLFIFVVTCITNHDVPCIKEWRPIKRFNPDPILDRFDFFLLDKFRFDFQASLLQISDGSKVGDGGRSRKLLNRLGLPNMSLEEWTDEKKIFKRLPLGSCVGSKEDHRPRVLRYDLISGGVGSLRFWFSFLTKGRVVPCMGYCKDQIYRSKG
jgi:hypothetical protein